MLMLDDIPDKHLDCIVETMGKISLNEKDFTRIVIEIISDIRTSIDEQEYLRNPEGSDVRVDTIRTRMNTYENDTKLAFL